MAFQQLSFSKIISRVLNAQLIVIILNRRSIRKYVLHLCCIVFMFSFSCYSEEKVTHEGCIDQFGTPVLSIERKDMPTVAMATRLDDGTPVVYYNPNALSVFTPQTCLFAYAHECAHHVLGHTIGEIVPDIMEQEADCWAARELYFSGQLSINDLDAIAEDMAKFFGNGSSVHLPGAERALNLYGCFDESELNQTDSHIKDDEQKRNKLKTFPVK